MTPQSELPGSVRQDIQQIVARAQARVSSQSVSATGQKLLRGMLTVLKRANSYDQLEQQVGRLIRDLDAGRAVLQGLLDEAVSAEAAWSNQQRFGDVWWQLRHREVTQAFAQGTAQGRHQWLETYAEALMFERFDVCLQMTLRDWPTPDGVEALRTGAAALQEGRYRDAIDTIELLVGTSEAVTDVPKRVVLLVFGGRIHLYELSDVTTAREWVDQAVALAPDDGRSRAALGECLRVSGELDQAREHFTHAIQVSERLPDGYIGAAMICEDQKSWHRALDFYDNAIEAAGETARFGQLLAPAPAGLYWQLARRQKKQEPARALEAIDRALELGIRWSDGYPERRALRNRGEILESLGRLSDAADSYFRAGQQYSWLGKLATARPPLEKACKLAPQHAAAHWQLSEVLRVLSYLKTAPFVDSDLVDLSKSHWETGHALKRPDAGTAWVYLGRALLNEQRWMLSKDPDVFWESLVFIECALLLNQDYATAWAYLAQYYRLLNYLQTALHATGQALSIDPTDVAGLEQRAAVLSLLGRYDEAEQMIDQRLEQAEEWWAVALKAYIEVRTGRPEPALEHIDRAVAAVPEDEQYRALRGTCRRRLGQREQSDEDFRWIWTHRDGPRGASWQPQTVAGAGYMLGEYDDAERILETALEENTIGLPELWSTLGQVRLARSDQARDDVTEGVRALERGIALIRDAGQLDDLLGFDLDELERILADRPGSEPAQEGVAQVRVLVRQRREALSRSAPTPDDELRANAETAPANSGMWLAARAGLARSASAAEQWDAALDAYLTLMSQPSFPEADVGLARVIGHLQEEADRLAADGLTGQARDAYETLLGYARERLGTQPGITAGLALRAGFAALTESDDEAAYRHLGLAISDPGSQRALAESGRVEELFVRSPAQYWNLADGLRRLRDRCGPQTQVRAVFDELIAGLSLSRFYRLMASEVTVFPMATPLALKLGPGLQPDADAGRESLRRDLDELRAHVEHDTGICLPGVRVLEAKGRGDYAILIDDTVVASGSVRLDQLNQDPPLVLVLRHLEAAVRRGLPSFIGVDDVQAWLDDAPREVSALARVALPDRSARVLLSRVLQVLALEGVPLTSPAVVLKQLQRAAPSAGVLGIAAAVRRQMRPSLPGNAPGTRRVNVPLPVEEALAAGLHATDGPVSWQLPRRETEPLLNRLREIGQDAQAGTPGALVVRSSVLRPFVWRLIVAEFPGLSVLSEEELIEREAKPAAAAVMA